MELSKTCLKRKSLQLSLSEKFSVGVRSSRKVGETRYSLRPWISVNRSGIEQAMYDILKKPNAMNPLFNAAEPASNGIGARDVVAAWNAPAFPGPLSAARLALLKACLYARVHSYVAATDPPAKPVEHNASQAHRQRVLSHSGDKTDLHDISVYLATLYGFESMSWSFIEKSLKEKHKPVNERKKIIFIRQLPPWHFGSDCCRI